MKQSIYLDYAAATPLSAKVLEAMEPVLTGDGANPSSLHSAGRQARTMLEGARGRIAKVLGAKPTEIIFTSGSTEAANIAIQGVALANLNGQVALTSIEHEAVQACTRALETQGHHESVITVGADGIVDPLQVSSAITDITALVCVQYANNEIGSIQPIAKIAALIAEVRVDRHARGITMPLYLYCDAAQAGLLTLQVSRLGVDLMSMGGSKLYGPAGSGFLYVRTGVTLEPVWQGGGQERGLRSGTENVAAAVGLATALELMQVDRTSETKRQQELRNWLWKEIQQQIPDVHLNGAIKPRLAGNLNVTFDGAAGETLVAYLDAEGFEVATGSACTAASQDPSHVLLAIGRSHSQAESSLRITLGHPSTKRQLQNFITSLVKVVARVRQLA